MKKFYLNILILIVAVSLSYKFYYLEKIDNITTTIYKTKSDEIIKLFNNEVEKKFGKTFALTNLLSKDKKLIEALVNKDSSILDYTQLIKETHKYGEYKNLWIQIIDKDGYSFYRSWTKKTGDHAASARLDIADMLKNPRPMKGISTGRFDMTFKTMMPLYSGKKFIGMIEMISKFNSIAIVMEKNGAKPLMVLHEDYKNRFIKPFTGLFIRDNYIANLNASKTLMTKAEKFGLKKLMYLKEPLVFEDYIVTTTEIKDVHGGEMGFFIFFFKENQLDKSSIYNFEIQYITKVIIGVVLFLLISLYRLNTNYTQSLKDEVKKKTKKLEETLKTYDDNVIFSKTDLKGNITYVSKAFCDISNYTKDELIGQPHNIVRHPDMEKSAFYNMWETIKKGQKWEGEVKNRKKDGGYYWVFSKIEPILENDEIVGYISTRTDITAKKEYEEQQLKMLNQTKMAAMGEMIGNIAHQWRQPLSIITTIASSTSLKQEHDMLKDEMLHENMEKIVDSAEYLSNTIETFRNFLTKDKEYKPVSIQKSVQEVLQILDTTITSNNIAIINNTGKVDDITIVMISGELEQVIINILNNAKDIFIEKEIKERTITIDLLKENNKMKLTIEDNGGGIPENILPKIFEAYFTTKHKSQGTGLGLHMSYRIITESLKGELSAINTNTGAKFIIEIPINNS